MIVDSTLRTFEELHKWQQTWVPIQQECPKRLDRRIQNHDTVSLLLKQFSINFTKLKQQEIWPSQENDLVLASFTKRKPFLWDKMIKKTNILNFDNCWILWNTCTGKYLAVCCRSCFHEELDKRNHFCSDCSDPLLKCNRWDLSNC